METPKSAIRAKVTNGNSGTVGVGYDVTVDVGVACGVVFGVLAGVGAGVGFGLGVGVAAGMVTKVAIMLPGPFMVAVVYCEFALSRLMESVLFVH